jgi:hypothetical protein
MDHPSDNFSPVRKCRKCSADITSAIESGARRCPACGTNIKKHFVRGSKRNALWVLFWLIFLGTPVVSLAAANHHGMVGFRIAIVGDILAGFALSALMRREGEDFIGMAFIFAFGIFFVYLGVFFVGCLVVLSNTDL